MPTSKHRIALSVILDLIFAAVCIWFHNYIIGTGIFSLFSVLYSFACSFVITYSTFLIIKKDGFKKYFLKKDFFLVFSIITIALFALYKPFMLILFIFKG